MGSCPGQGSRIEGQVVQVILFFRLRWKQVRCGVLCSLSPERNAPQRARHMSHRPICSQLHGYENVPVAAPSGKQGCAALTRQATTEQRQKKKEQHQQYQQQLAKARGLTSSQPEIGDSLTGIRPSTWSTILTPTLPMRARLSVRYPVSFQGSSE